MSKPLNAEIRAFLVDNFLFGEGGDRFTDEDSLVEAGLIDSLGVAELVAHIEARYGVAASDDELVPDNFDSVTRIAAFIERKAAPAAQAA
jgi:acyl carrier protein